MRLEPGAGLHGERRVFAERRVGTGAIAEVEPRAPNSGDDAGVAAQRAETSVGIGMHGERVATNRGNDEVR